MFCLDIMFIVIISSLQILLKCGKLLRFGGNFLKGLAIILEDKIP